MLLITSPVKGTHANRQVHYHIPCLASLNTRNCVVELLNTSFVRGRLLWCMHHKPKVSIIRWCVCVACEAYENPLGNKPVIIQPKFTANYCKTHLFTTHTFFNHEGIFRACILFLLIALVVIYRNFT